MLNIKKFWNGLRIVAKTVLSSDTKGELEVLDSDGKLNYHNGTTRSPVVTESHTATITNKTVNADNNTITDLEVDNLKSGVLNTSTTLASASNTQLPSALAVKTYIDDKTAAQNDASEITFTPAGSISATNVQDAVEEVDTDIQNHIGDASDAHDASAISITAIPTISATEVQGALAELQNDIATVGSDLGAHIVDASDAHDASAISVVPAGNLAATDVQAALVELQGDADAASTHIAASTNVHGLSGGAAVVGTTSAQTLTNKIVTGADIRTPVRADVKQDTKANLITYALTASNGQLVFATDTKEMFQVVDALLVDIGSGSGLGGVDILFTQTFESAALSDFTQTGLTLSTSSPLHGEVSALLVHQPASSRSFKQVISVDRKFRGESMTLRLNAKSNATAGNVTINIYDETNAANLVASEQLQLSNDTSGALSRVGFTIPSTCASLSYTITALQESGSPETRIDDIIAELAVTSLLETSVEVPVITAWQGYTPTFTGFGTPSAVEFEWRQVGENVEIRGKFTSGTSTAVEARVSLPGGLTSAGTGIIPSIQLAGVYVFGAATTTHGGSVLIEPSVGYMTFSTTGVFGSTSTNALSKSTADAVATNGNPNSLFAKIPCSGLSATTTKTIALTQSGLVQEGDSELKVYGASGYGSTATRVVRFSTLQTSTGSAIQYNASAVNGDSFVALEDGFYSVTAYLGNSAANAARAQIAITKNGTQLTTDPSGIPQSEVFFKTFQDNSAAAEVSTGSWSGPLVAGDVIRVHGDGTTPETVYLGFSMTFAGSLKQVSVSSDQKITIPTSELRFEGASTRGAVATAIVRFDTVAKIRGDAFTVTSTANDGTFVTMTKAGKLDVNLTLLGSSTNGLSLTKNQTTLTTNVLPASEILAAFNPSASGFGLSASWSGFVSVGDIIRVAGASNPTANNINQLNFSFQEQDISVSVTNTLPQFSDSDSSVFVSGANGFGSTSTDVRRYTTILQSIGTDVEYVDSATLGASFTAKAAGIYYVTYSEQTTANVTTAALFITVNGTIVAYSREAINTASVTNKLINCSWSGYLNAGDVVRGIVNSAAENNGQDAKFTMSKVGKPNVTGVDVTAFVNVPQPVFGYFNRAGAATGSTNTTIVTFTGATFKNSLNDSALSYFNDSTLGDRFVALKKCRVRVSFSTSTISLANGAYEARLLKNDTTGATTNTLDISFGTVSSGAGPEIDTARLGGSYELDAGDTLRFYVSSAGSFNLSGTAWASLEVEALSDQILTAPETFSTDTASLTYAGSGTYTLATLNTAPVGTFITFTYTGGTNTRTQTTAAPTQTTADMNVNGIRLFTRVFAATSTAASPACIAIQIGKGLKGRTLDTYKSTGKTTAGSLDFYLAGTGTQAGAIFKDYNELTGVLLVDVGTTYFSTITTSYLVFSDNTFVSDGYLVINASKSPALTGVPLLLPRIATISDVKASGTDGGTATVGAYATRTLNTLSDPTGIVTGLTSNQFTLPAGEYYIEAMTPAYFCENAKSKLRNITDSTDALIGGTVYIRSTGTGDNAAQVMTYSPIRGNVVINSAKTFEIQMRVGITVATSGFGIAGSFGDSEVYTIVKITKVK